MTYSFIYITTPSKEEAERIANALLQDRLVACANILSAHQALFRWEGRIESAEEVAVIFKTRADLFLKVEEKIKENHSYECPCIVSLPIEQGSIGFLDWVSRETQYQGI